jgi:hypothetical protein
MLKSKRRQTPAILVQTSTVLYVTSMTMAPKRKNKEVQCVRWSLSQLKVLATVLADDQTDLNLC